MVEDPFEHLDEMLMMDGSDDDGNELNEHVGNMVTHPPPPPPPPPSPKPPPQQPTTGLVSMMLSINYWI